MSRFVLLLGLVLSASSLFAQQKLTGRVTDDQGQSLAFATVLLNDTPGQGVLTDIEGRFSIESNQTIQSLTIRYVGYQTRRLGVDFLEKTPGKPLLIVLSPSDLALPEATIHAGENPADILIRKAIARRKENNPELRRTYRCKTYNKILFDARPHRDLFNVQYAGKDTSKTAVQEAIADFDRLEKSTGEHHGFLMESVTERSFMFPNQVQEKVLLNRVSGFQNAGLVALANQVQPFTFYGDYLTILDKNFVNPVSPGSPALYFFNIEDTLYSGPDTIWIISFHPRKGKTFEGLEGVLHLHSHGWAVQNVRAQPAFSGNIRLKIEQAYQLCPGNPEQWFPAQLNFELEFVKYPAPYLGLLASGRSYVSAVEIDPPLRPRDFNEERPILMAPQALAPADSAWTRWRNQAPLSPKEWRTYQWLDSLGRTKRFDLLAAVLDAAATGLAPIGRSPFSVDLTRIIRLNDYENIRLGVGFTTAQPKPLLPPKRLEFGAWAGYGFRDRGWKYGADALWRIQRNGKTQLRLAWKHELEEPGALYELPASSLVNRALYARRMEQLDEWSAGLGSRLGRAIWLEGSLRRQDVRPAYAYRFGSTDTGYQEEFRFAESTLYLRYADGERRRNFLGDDVGSTQRLPVLELAYTRGWNGFLKGEYGYERWVAALYHSFFIRRLGRTSWRIEAGMVSARTPLPKLFTLNQGGGGWNLFVVPNTFQSLPDTLFLADRFANLYLAQEIGPVLYRRKYSAPALTLLQNIAWGALRRPELHDIGFRTAFVPLLESGLQLDNLLRVNYLNFAYLGVGGAVFYRWGGLGEPDWHKNLLFRLSIKMTL